MYDPCFPIAAVPRVHPFVGAVRRALHIGHPAHHAPVHHAAIGGVVPHPAVVVPPPGCVGVVNPIAGARRVLPSAPGAGLPGGVPGGVPTGELGGAAPGSSGGLSGGGGLVGGGLGGLGGLGSIGAGAAALGAGVVAAGSVGAVLATNRTGDRSGPAVMGPTDLAPMNPSFAVPPSGIPGIGMPIVTPTGTPPGAPDQHQTAVPEPASVLLLTVAIVLTVLVRQLLGFRWSVSRRS